MQVIGSCNGSGKIVLTDSEAPPDTPVAVDLNLETVLGDLPQKSYSFPEYETDWARALELPAGETPADALQRVLQLPSVGSKRFLTTKVDRCVTGAPPLPASPGPETGASDRQKRLSQQLKQPLLSACSAGSSGLPSRSDCAYVASPVIGTGCA